MSTEEPKLVRVDWETPRNVYFPKDKFEKAAALARKALRTGVVVYLDMEDNCILTCIGIPGKDFDRFKNKVNKLFGLEYFKSKIQPDFKSKIQREV